MIHLRKITCALLTLHLSLGPLFIHARAAAENNHDMSHPASASTDDDNQAIKRGLQFRLSEGVEQAEVRQQPAAATSPLAVAKLSDADTQKVLARLPEIKSQGEDGQDFALRENSLPPPRTGRTVLTAFPAPAQPAAPDADSAAEPLQVLRHAPDGEVPLAPQLSVTFSQPMVSVTSHDDLAAEGVPVKLTPQPAGKWRWVGTKTLLFQPEERFPMATQYSVTVPASTKPATGAPLGTAATWSFATPPPQVKTKYPEGDSHARNAIMFVEFDQRISPAAVMRTVKVRAGGNAEVRVRLATAEEIAADENVRRLASAAGQGRWLAFRAVGPGSSDGDARTALPGNANITISIGPNTPSAEGPRTTTAAQDFSFRTFGPLRVTRHECGWNKRCTPFDDWRITFSNPLDATLFQKSQVRVEPELPSIKTDIYGNTLHIRGLKRGRTTYRVKLDPSVRDTFGQTLGESAFITFDVGSAPPSLTAQGGHFTVIDPSSQPRFSIFSINHKNLKVSLYKVGPEEWSRFINYMRYSSGHYNDEAAQKQTTPPGRLAFSKTITVDSQPDEMAETRLDLAPALDGEYSQVIVVVESTLPVKNRRERQAVRSWVQVTGIGLDAFVDHSELIGWTTSLKNGQPLEGVRLSIQPSDATGTSGLEGLARLTLAPSKPKEPLNILVARRGRDIAILPEHTDWWNGSGGWHRRYASDFLRWYVFDDRKMYRPGEEVHIKGWLRRLGGGQRGDVGPLNGAVGNVSYVLKDSRGNEITKGTLRPNALGGFDTKLKLPGTMNLGHTTLQFEAQGTSGVGSGHHHQHNFQVQEFRRPEFEVTAKASEGPHFVGEHAQAFVTAAYFAGGALPNSEVVWNVSATPANYTPPNRNDFTFGSWFPWWHERVDAAATNFQTFAGRTDAAGKHHLRIDFDSVNPPRPSSVTAQASVTDVNRQTWTATSTMLVHPADLYVGLRSPRTFVQQSEPLVVESIVTDLDGNAVVNREVRMRAVLLDWTYKNNSWQQEEHDPQECTVKSAKEALKCTFQPKEGGTYRVTAQVMDDRERRNESELTLWVAGGKTPPRRDVAQEKIELIPDRKEYQAGDTAEVLVQSPFYPAEGVMSLRRSGIVRTERFRMDGPSHTLRVPIEESFMPNVHVQIDLVGAAARADNAGQVNEKLPKRPAFAVGTLNLPIPPLKRKLLVGVTPRDKALEPGGETALNVEVKDAGGEPVAGSEVAVVIVDEAILALTNYKLEDPLATFYAHRGADTRDHHLRQSVLLSNPEDLAARQISELPMNARGYTAMSETVSVTDELRADAPMAKGAAVRRRERASAGKLPASDEAIRVESNQIRMRENFNALAFFAASVPTDANGRAVVSVKVPDNLTRYRVMAVSVAGGKQFGSGESAITARMPLMVRPSAPRFLNFGDRFELPVVLQNQTDAPMNVDVAVRAANADLTDGGGRRVTVPANDRIEVRFPTAAARAGTARFQIGAASGRWTDAAEIQLPVWTPATTEAFATYGEIDGGAIVQPVKAPSGVVPQFGGLEITTSSTQLQALTDAVLYLVSYPYECSEQLSSRVLAIAALRDVLTAFAAKDMPTPDEMKAAVARDIKRLHGMQNDDGGFAFWRRGDESWPYVSIHVAHALQRAKEKKFDVPDAMLDKSKRYLRDIERHIPSYYSREAREALIAYALNVRHRMNDRDASRARRLVKEAGLEKLSLEAVGWLLPVLSGDAGSKLEVEAIRRHLNNHATETAGTAHFTSAYSDGEHLLLHSERRADGIILEALIGDQPQSDLIAKIVRGLLAHRKAGRWSNTQENVFILLALDRYFAVYEKATPDFIARAWLGDRFAGSQEFRGRTTDRQQVNVPMRFLAENATAKPQNLVLSKDGPGRLYYRVGMRYAPANLKLAPMDQGFTVERAYEAVDEPANVRRDADGAWHIKTGARVRVRLTMVAPTRRYHVALVDPMPAGLEALNPALAVTGNIPLDQKNKKSMTGGRSDYWWWTGPWFEHQNFRDERAEAFASLLWEGVHTYSYVARATTPGAFVVPPPKAEEMYHPETFGRGATDRVHIE